MDIGSLLDKLGYEKSPSFLLASDARFNSARGFGHVFRHAAQTLNVAGVYTLQNNAQPSSVPIPVAYVAEAESEEDAAKKHRLIWNQDAVPLAIILTRGKVRVYSGFEFSRVGDRTGLLMDAQSINDILPDLSAQAIDSGLVWKTLGRQIDPSKRVQWRLLDNLKNLDLFLQRKRDVPANVSHGLIGKMVYLHYLRSRDILSDEKLRKWDLSWPAAVGPDATLRSFAKLVGNLDTWLNGSVFPLALSGKEAPSDELIRTVGSIFAGGDQSATGGLQLSLPFNDYDFSYIPIETLSVVYEQFLHNKPSETGHKNKGDDQGAYYTPIPLVNFMLAELEEHRPLAEGMRILDPSCGSGAFLVQCYRRLIENHLQASAEAPKPSELRELLQRHIFGVDKDADACSVTELSLVMTLLDYVDPPDLEKYGRFKLPTLRNANILNEDFSHRDSAVLSDWQRRKFDWIVGNPPWVKVARQSDAFQWISRLQKAGCPIAGNQLSQAFVWEIADYLRQDGVAALLLPAMTLFEDPSRAFRKGFLNRYRAHTIANFSNLAEVLFAGRARFPAMAAFFALRSLPPDAEESIVTFSPFVANQECTRPNSTGEREQSWTLTINGSELSAVETQSVSEGDALPWKVAAWGTSFDLKLLRRLSRFKTLGDLEKEGLIVISQGLELRRKDDTSKEPLDPVPDLEGKLILEMDRLREVRGLFAIPPSATRPIAAEECYARKGRSRLPLQVCQRPHVIVSAARNFAVFADEFIVVPPRQIGIASTTGDATLLKTIAAYLNSDLAYYHQFYTSSEMTAKRPRATLEALRNLPFPIPSGGDALGELALLWKALSGSEDTSVTSQSRVRLNDVVRANCGLSSRELSLVTDLTNIKLGLRDGKVEPQAAGLAAEDDLTRYAAVLRSELDAFVANTSDRRHTVSVLVSNSSDLAMIAIDFVTSDDSTPEVQVFADDDQAASPLKAIRKKLASQYNQWVYFNRDLRVFSGRRTYLFKPMQRFHWTQSQAMADAAEIIAATVGGGQS